MTHFPSRSGVIALTLAAGCGLGAFLNAQTVADGPSTQADSNGAVPVASVAPATADKMLDASIAPRDSKGRHMAPRDTFYLLEYVSAKTDKGVEGFEPGQEVHLVEVHRPTHTLVVSNGRAQVEVEPSKLTNNMDIAALVRQKDLNNQARIAAYVQAEEAASHKAEKEAAEAAAKDIEHHNQEQVAESRVGDDLQASQPASQVAAAYNDGGVGSGYYGYGNNGYGSPYSYFGGYSNQTVVNPAPRAPAAAAPAAAPAVGVPVGTGGGKVAAPGGGGSAVGRPK